MKDTGKARFYTGAFFLTMAVFCVSFFPILLKRMDLIFLVSMLELKRLMFVFAIVAGGFWLSTDKFFKEQVLYSGILAAFFVLAIFYNKSTVFP